MRDAIPTVGETIAAAEQLHGRIMTERWFALSKTERGPLEPFVRKLNAYWSQGDGADPSHVLAALPAAREAFEALDRAGKLPSAGVDAVDNITPAATEAEQEALPEPGLNGGVEVDPIHQPTEASGLFRPLAENRVAQLDPALLMPHPLSAELFASVDAAAQVALEQDVAEHGIDKPIRVTGDGCASPPNTVLSGNRRREAALKAGRPVPVIVVDGLSADEEAFLVIRGNLSDIHARKLTEEVKYWAEKKLREIVGRRKGQRTDLPQRTGEKTRGGTWTGASPGSDREEKTSETVAKMAGATRNAVEDRTKIFDSVVTTEALKNAVSNGAITRTAAATIVRAIEIEHRSGLHDPAVLNQAKAKIDLQVRRVIDTKGKKSRTGKAKQTGKGTTATARTAVKKPAAAAPMPPRDPHATQMQSAQPRESTRPDSVVTLPDFDAFERAAEGIMSFSTTLHRLLSRDASDESMALFKEVQAGRGPHKLPPTTAPELKRLLTLHRIVSKILTPVVTGKVRLTLMRLVEAVGPLREELAPEPITPAAGASS